MAGRTYIATLENAEMGGSTNPSLVGFSFAEDLGESDLTLSARILYYFRFLTALNVMSACQVTRIRSKDATAVGASLTDTPYPAAAAATLNAKVASAFQISDTGPYGQNFNGGGDLAVRGSSVCMSENGETGGRTGNGRHYIPFLAAQNIDSQGLLGSARATIADNCWSDAFRGTTLSGAFNTANQGFGFSSPVNTGAGGITPIIGVKARTLVSVLNSRRR